MEQIRHGDVFLEKIKKLPEAATKINTNVLAEGEATGHVHAVMNALVLEGLGFKFVDVQKGSEAYLTHQEHGVVPLSEGIWQVTQQREYDPIKERRVQD